MNSVIPSVLFSMQLFEMSELCVIKSFLLQFVRSATQRPDTSYLSLRIREARLFNI